MNKPGLSGITLAESPLFRLYALYEQPYLLDKTTRQIIPLRDHYGDPSCGLIDPEGQWCAVGGEGGSVFFPDTGEEAEYLAGCFIQSLGMGEPGVLEIHTDSPEGQNGLWRLDVGTRELRPEAPPGGSG